MKISNKTVVKKASSLGFDLVGFAKAENLEDETNKLRRWLSKNYQAGMSYMERNIEKRREVRNVLQGAKSVISLAVNYYTPAEHNIEGKKSGKISRYAWGTDYHLVIWNMLDELERELKKIDPDFDSISYIDTGPVMDKVWAVRSGLGWMGKHTNIINKDLGSWIFLATIITSYEFEYSEVIPDFCGSCTACIDACPTDAIVEPYVVDSNRCISYLTIENKNGIPEDLNGKFDKWLFGCDICQDVCPWNIKFAEITEKKDFYPREKRTELELNAVLKMDKREFEKNFSRSPIKRAKLKGLQRNAEFLKESDRKVK